MASRATRRHIRVTDPEYRRCSSQKRGYATYAEALDAAEDMMRAGRVNRGCHITPYQCDECPLWHVANKRILFPPI